MKPFTPITKIYLFITYLAGILIFALRIRQVNFQGTVDADFLCILASLALILKVEGSTESIALYIQLSDIWLFICCLWAIGSNRCHCCLQYRGMDLEQAALVHSAIQYLEVIFWLWN